MILPLLACLTLVGASSAPLAVSSLPYCNEPLPQCAVYDDTNKSITLTAYELNNYTFPNLCNVVFVNTWQVSDFGSVSYDSASWISYEFDTSESLSYLAFYYFSDNVERNFYLNNSGDFVHHFSIKIGDNESIGSFTGSVVWSITNSDLYQSVKTAIQADISANSSITLTADQLNNYTFSNLINAFVELGYTEVDVITSSIMYDGNLFGYNEYTASIDDRTLSYVADNDEICFYAEGYGEKDGHFVLSINGETSPFVSSITWHMEGYSPYFKSAIEADILRNEQGMTGVEVVNEIVDILAGGLTSLGSALGGAIATFAQSLAFQDGELSVYFVLIVVFAGVSLAIGLTTLLFNWLTNLGR